MSEVIIKCEGVYKIFGENAKKMLKEANGNVDAKTFQENGCIVGVNNASFEVSKGEMLVVMGLSGSGKSTLLRCISRLTDTTSGKIFIEGQDLLQLNNRELIDLRRNKMGMVFQSFALLPHKTVVENIAFPLQIKGIKTDDYYFSGFPALWNLVVLYFHLLGTSELMNIAVVLFLSVFTFIPIKYVHPMRVLSLRKTTLMMTFFWCLTTVYLLLAVDSVNDINRSLNVEYVIYCAWIVINLYFLFTTLRRSFQS